MPCGCLADALRMPCGCLADALRMPCGCLADALRMPWGCLADALRMPCGCLENPLEYPSTDPVSSGRFFPVIPAHPRCWCRGLLRRGGAPDEAELPAHLRQPRRKCQWWWLHFKQRCVDPGLGGSWYLVDLIITVLITVLITILGHFRALQVGYTYSHSWLISTMNLQVQDSFLSIEDVAARTGGAFGVMGNLALQASNLTAARRSLGFRL